jgi:hypothetical protein
LIIRLIIQTILLYPSGAVWTDEASNLSRPDPSGADQIDAEHPSRRWPIPTLWWLRPVMSATRVGEHNAVVWNRVYFSPWPATRSAVGISHGPPKALPAPKPTSSNNTSSTFGALRAAGPVRWPRSCCRGRGRRR